MLLFVSVFSQLSLECNLTWRSQQDFCSWSEVGKETKLHILTQKQSKRHQLAFHCGPHCICTKKSCLTLPENEAHASHSTSGSIRKLDWSWHHEANNTERVDPYMCVLTNVYNISAIICCYNVCDTWQYGDPHLFFIAGVYTSLFLTVLCCSTQWGRHLLGRDNQGFNQIFISTIISFHIKILHKEWYIDFWLFYR